MPSFAQIKDMMSSRPVGGGRGFVNPPMAKREPLVMPDDMDDQPPSAQFEEADRRRKAAKGYERSSKGYAKGGSVKGGGCEQRGLRKCKVI